MINKLREVAPTVYRGSAPSPQDVVWLKEKLGINKVISLDQESGQKIDRICKLLGIKHIMLPLDGSKKALMKLLQHNLKKLLLQDGPTYFHCFHGKDRTGLLAALFECKYLHKDPEEAIKNAKSLGFGVGVDPAIINLYEKLIRNCKPATDNNEADIVSNEREYRQDNRDSYLDGTHQTSFSPYLGKQREYPYTPVYNEIDNQSSTRENYDIDNSKENEDENEDEMIPMVGQYNNSAGLFGAGPIFPAGGFISD